MYSFDARIRYSETDAEEVLTLNSIINYFQDAAIFNSEDVGYGVETLGENNCAWVLCSWQIEVVRYPKFGEKVKVTTFPYDFKGFMGSRNCYMTSESGEYLVKANCIWTYMDMAKMRPVKVPLEIISSYESGEKIPMNYKSRKIDLPETEGEKFEPVTIERHHIDSLGHVNNGQYVRLAMNYKTTPGRVMEFRAEYKSQAHLGDKVYPERYDLLDKEIIALKDENGNVYSSIEIIK